MVLINKNIFYLFLKVWFYVVNYFLSARKVKKSGTAAVYKICFRKEVSRELPSVSDFYGLFEGYFHSSIILSDSISLYTITESTAVFVDCGALDVFCSKYGAFVYNTQLVHAKRFIVLSTKSFHKIAAEISLPKVPIVHLANHGRCGSTLLAQIFENIPNALSISETYSFSDLAEFSRKGQVDFHTLKQLCFSTLMCTFKHANSRQSQLIFLKCQNVAVYITELMSICAPSIKSIYMYRNPISFVRSCEKLYAISNRKHVPVLRTKIYSGIGKHSILQSFPTYSDSFLESLTVFSSFGFNWITGAAAFKKLRNKIEIKSISYEDLLTNADNIVLKLFDYAGIPKDVLPDISSILKNDSQVGTAFSSRNISKKFLQKACTPITEELKKEVNSLCSDFDVPYFWNFDALPDKL
nr:uncharacterized protein LOC105847934 [Hydra vulgaris]